jgi:DNA modification methylase
MKFNLSSPLDATVGGSATREHKSVAREFDLGPLLKKLVYRYQKQKRPISVNFRRILPNLNSAERFAHLIHPYPAKLLVHIPLFFLASDLLSKPGDTVLDPFCGSGTVLSESQLASRRAYGADANPLARLIARVKIARLNTAMATRALDTLLRRIPTTPRAKPPDVVNIEHWFYPSTVRKLQCLLEAIEQLRNPEVRDFLLVCFSVCVRKVSLADPRLSVPVKLKFGQYPKGHALRAKTDAHFRRLRRVNVAEVFDRIARANLGRMEKVQACSSFCADGKVICADARHLVHQYSRNGRRGKQLGNESVQLVITSPPYPGAQKYIRSCSLSMGWLRLCPTGQLRAHKACIIGREEFTKSECADLIRTNIVGADRILTEIRQRNPTRATIAATYLNDMRTAMKEMCRVLKPGGHVVLVAANNRIASKRFRTVDYLRAIAEDCGLSLTACFVDAIRSRGLMTKRNKTASIITREWVLLFTKGGLPEWAR